MDFLAKIVSRYTFEPIGSNSFKMALKLKDGDFVRIENWKERNVNFHRKYFSFLNTVIYFLPEDQKFDKLRNIDYLREEIMILTGNVDQHITMDGIQHLKPKSISFKNMDEESFEKVYQESVTAALKYFLPDISYEDFEQNLLNFL